MGGGNAILRGGHPQAPSEPRSRSSSPARAAGAAPLHPQGCA